MAPDPEQRPAAQRESTAGRGEETAPHESETYRYEHSGIQERHGGIPIWLALVVLGLIVWSIYYTIRYWSE